jgi:hypothetical protein
MAVARPMRAVQPAVEGSPMVMAAPRAACSGSQVMTRDMMRVHWGLKRLTNLVEAIATNSNRGGGRSGVCGVYAGAVWVPADCGGGGQATPAWHELAGDWRRPGGRRKDCAQRFATLLMLRHSGASSGRHASCIAGSIARRPAGKSHAGRRRLLQHELLARFPSEVPRGP